MNINSGENRHAPERLGRVADKSLLIGNLIPLLLSCGHPVCTGCVKKKIIYCSSCNKDIQDNTIKKLPLNLYTLGLLISSSQRPMETNDEDFVFCHTVALKLRQIKSQGFCYECGTSASIKCVQCMVLFCSCCYSKIHGKALQNHTQISLVKEEYDSFCTITNNCSSTCSEALSYFCNDCGTSGCSNCMLLKHKMHDYVTLKEKNKEMIPEFNEVNQKIMVNLQRINQTRKKLKSTLISTYEPQECDDVEMIITKHFARLHGVLQNLEAELMNQLQQRRNSLKNNLAEVEVQLRAHEEQLNIAVTMASYAANNFDKVDMRNAIKVLSEMADLPCHVIRNNYIEDEAMSFTIDEEIIPLMENHCTLQVPQVSRYQLVRTEVLPEDYVLEPVAKDFIGNIFNETSLLKAIKSPTQNTLVASNVSTVTQTSQPEKTHEDKDVNKHQVEVTHIVSPSLFFVRYLSSKAKFIQLEKDLQAYAETCENNSVELQQDDMCVVKQLVKYSWNRGRVIAVNTSNSFETTYDIFYIDYGYKEQHVTNSRIWNIKDEHLKLKPQAIQCCLHGIVPLKNTWTNKSTKDFIKLLRDVSVFMHIVKHNTDILHVDICTTSSKDNSMGPQSICNAMIFMKHARSNTSTAQMRLANIAYAYQREELMLNKVTSVVITHVKSPAKIYVSKKGQRQVEYMKLLDELNEYCENNTEPPIISTPKEGLPCIAQYLDDIWHRCEIVKIISKDEVEVFYVDLGHTITLSCDLLRMIPYKYTQYKAQAIRIALMYVSPDPDGKWKTEAIDTLSNIFDGVISVNVIPRKKINDGYVGCMNLAGISDVSRLLKSKGVVTNRDHNKSQHTKKIVPHNIDTLESIDSSIKELSLIKSESDTKSVQEEETIKDPFKMEVCIKRLVTPDCIYVAQTDHKESNENLITAMQQFYNSYCSEARDNWAENALCAVYSAKDKSYFRAQILKIKSPTEVLVYFCDIGIDETVTMKDIQVLHPKFTKQPAHCFKVKLAGILPCGGSSIWPSLSCSTLTDIIRTNSRCKFYITKLVQQETCDNVIPVELWVKQIKIPGPLAPSKVEINSVNRMLVENGVALPIKDYFSKTDSVLVLEFKRQLLNSHRLVSSDEQNDIQWINKNACRSVNCKIDDSSTSSENELLDQNISAGISEKKLDCSKMQSDWLPPVEIVEEVFHAIPTYVDNDGAVYLHSLKQNAQLINFIEYELESHFLSKEIKIEKNWEKGDICIAKYHINNKWYRGRVLKVSGTLLQIEFVDYGNVEECNISCATKNIKMDHIPIQCTKCVISGLSPETASGNWMLHDLDRLHFLLVDKKCEVCILQRLPTHLIVSIKLLEERRNILKLLSEYKYLSDMKIKIEPKEWNNAIHEEKAPDSTSSSVRNSAVEEITDNVTIADTSQKSLKSETQEVMLKENVISGTLAETAEESKYNDDKGLTDFQNISWPDIFIADDFVISSTPQNESLEEENFFSGYKSLSIPQDTKYIEVILCCNINSTTSYAQLAENDDDIFSHVLHDYYLQYEAIMLDIQKNASSRPLIKFFKNYTPCIAKFTDDQWYRCIITQSEKSSDNQSVDVMLHYIDYGNNEHKMLDLSIENHDLRVPKQEWIEVPAMAIECKFWNLEFVSDDIDLLASQLDKIYNTAVVARVKEIRDNMMVAEIYEDKTCQKLLYAHLIDEGLYQYKKSKDD
ncbi:RING finger protein 17 isoform X2 [Harpegnathos saltator]|uniref:RING finger protein 17 isoform X2 n=1 Tax=Harpegnathos saltator TaxID=610380 RepID=UPI0009491B1F|nr:RING finger protein 17 isoform X2 [Harpegnathos saltator]